MDGNGKLLKCVNYDVEGKYLCVHHACMCAIVLYVCSDLLDQFHTNTGVKTDGLRMRCALRRTGPYVERCSCSKSLILALLEVLMWRSNS